MATSTALAQVNKLLKTVYEPEFEPLFNEEFVGWKLCAKPKKKFRGGAEIIAMRTSRAKGVGFRTETGGLPTPNGAGVLQTEVPLKRMFGTGELTHDLIELSKEDEAAFEDGMTFELESLFGRLLKQSNIYFYGNGSGILCTVATAGGGTLAASGTLSVTVDTTRYLEEGDIVALWTSSAETSTVLTNGGQDTASNELCTISSITSETVVVLALGAVGGNATVVAGNTLRMFGDKTTGGTAAAPSGLVWTGLAAFADDGTNISYIQGKDRTAAGQTRLKGNLINGNAANLRRSHLYKLSDLIRRRCGRSMDTIFWDLTMRRDYLEITQPDARYVAVKEADAGYSEEALVLTLGKTKVALHEDSDVPYGDVLGFVKKHLMFMQRTPFELDESTGAPLKQGTAYGSGGTGDKFYFYVRCKGNFATDCPPAFGRIYGLNYELEAA